MIKPVKKNDHLDFKIRELIGNNRAMVSDFREVVIQLHRDYEASVVRRNCAIRSVTSQFGVSGFDYVRMVGNLRAGQDPDSIKRFDEMAEYAAAHYPEVMGGRRTESETGSAEESFAKLLIEGIQPLPKVWDDEVLQSALSYVGQGFFEAYAEPELVDGDGEVVPRKERVAMTDAIVEKAVVRLEAYYAKIKQSIDDEVGGAPAIGWPKYRLSRLRNEIAKLPLDAQETAKIRTKFATCVAMVDEHCACSAF